MSVYIATWCRDAPDRVVAVEAECLTDAHDALWERYNNGQLGWKPYDGEYKLELKPSELLSTVQVTVTLDGDRAVLAVQCDQYGGTIRFPLACGDALRRAFTTPPDESGFPSSETVRMKKCHVCEQAYPATPRPRQTGWRAICDGCLAKREASRNRTDG